MSDEQEIREQMESAVESAKTDVDVMKAKYRIERAVSALMDNRLATEKHLQHAYYELGGDLEDLYNDGVDTEKIALDVIVSMSHQAKEHDKHDAEILEMAADIVREKSNE